MRIAIVGTGYVGLVSGACFADFGHQVTCIDNDSAKIAELVGGRIPIYEPGLEEIVANNVKRGLLAFTDRLGPAVRSADAVFIAVGTPSRRGDGHADLTYVYAAAREIARNLDGFTVVATKSTVPIGTSDEIERIIAELRPDADFAVVSNPEFLREGAAIQDFKHPDRIVIGTDDDARAKDVMREVYRPLYLNAAPLLFTGRRSSEMIKYASNAFLATKISFINEVATLCEQVGADVQDVSRGMGLDNRIGAKFLHAGPGFGGSCFPKDTVALIKTGQDHGVHLRILEAVAAVNDVRKRSMAQRVVAALGGSVRARTVAVLGLTFKPNTDDVRDSPATPLIVALTDFGAKVRVYDPAGMDNARSQLPDVAYCADAYDCAQKADALVIVTEWEEFRALDFARLRKAMAQPVLVDLRNVYTPQDVIRNGFSYAGIGRRADDVALDAAADEGRRRESRR
jgi:UDPglucose 6-dehydrogenase